MNMPLKTIANKLTKLLMPLVLLSTGNFVDLRSNLYLTQVHCAGYTIPAGWAIMVCPPAVHLNPDTYEDPLAFNPWRWEVGHCS